MVGFAKVRPIIVQLYQCEVLVTTRYTLRKVFLILYCTDEHVSHTSRNTLKALCFVYLAAIGRRETAPQGHKNSRP